MSTSDGTDLTKAVLPAEIWNPDTETWTTVASLQNGRQYHSTALLLPDGRVLMAGGGALPGRATDQTNAEIYSPPYLFKGARPTITSAPGTVRATASSFDVTTPNAAQIAKVSLIRLAVRHARASTRTSASSSSTSPPGAGKVTVQAPANANLAPPGDYMLFLLDTNGVPSVASIVRLSATRRHDAADRADRASTAAPTPGQVALAWTASTDAGGHRALQRPPLDDAGLHPEHGANRIAQPTGHQLHRRRPSRRAPTTTRSRPTTPPATRARPRTRRARPSPSGPLPGLVARLRLRRGQRHDDGGPVGQRQQRHAREHDLGGRGAASSATRSPSTARTPSSRSPDSNSLDLDDGHDARRLGQAERRRTGFRTLVVKEQPGDLVYGLYANSDTNRPQSQVTSAPPARLLRRHGALPAGDVDASRRHLRRHHPAALRQRRRRSRRSRSPGTIPTSAVAR